MNEVIERLDKKIAERGLSRRGASLLAGLGADAIRDMERKGGSPRVTTIEKLAGVLNTSVNWLMYGTDDVAPETRIRTVPLVGYVGAGAAAVLFGEGHELNDEVTAPPGATDKTVAVEIRGTSLGELFDEWLVFYDDVRDPPGGKQINKLCVCWLADGRVLIKKLKRSHIDGYFTLHSNTEPPIYDVAVLAAAVVINMAPR